MGEVEKPKDMDLIDKSMATFKFKKTNLKKKRFDVENIEDPIYVLLPSSSNYT